MARNCIVVNVDRCTGCYSCEITCKMENGIALGFITRIIKRHTRLR